MSEPSSNPGSLGHRLSPVMCADPVVHQLTDVQQAALHMCKHEMLASMFRLYMVVPQKTADQLLSKFFKDPGANG